MKNKTQKTKKTRFPLESAFLYLLAFLIPVIVMVMVLKSRGFYPFGEKTLFIMDKVSKVNKKRVIFRHFARKKDGTIIRPRFARCLVIPVDD